MLTRLYAHNYRSLVNFEIEFGRLNVLLGYNGSGKSSTFDVLHALKGFVSGSLRVEDAFPSGTLSRGLARQDDVQRFELELEGNGGRYSYELGIEFNTSRNVQRVIHETLQFNGKPLFRSARGEATLFNRGDVRQARYQRDPDYC